jgi:hypothetical protein
LLAQPEIQNRKLPARSAAKKFLIAGYILFYDSPITASRNMFSFPAAPKKFPSVFSVVKT